MTIVRTLFCFSLICLLGRAVAAAPGDPGCRFDIDSDGFVTQADLNYCMGLIQVFPPLFDSRCDANGNGILDASDFAQILAVVQSGLDCRMAVPSGTMPSRWILLGGLMLMSGLALRFAPAERTTS